MATAASPKKSAKKKTAKKRGPRSKSKSAAIREYLKSHPDAGPTAVVNALKKKGITLTPAHVSNVKTAMLKKAGGAGSNGSSKGRRGRPSAGAKVSIDGLIAARKFADNVGGLDEAVALLHSLAKLQ